MNIKIKNVDYEIIENYRDAIDEELLEEAVTEYYDDFDYIVGDWAYGKLRLKGFNEKNNKNYKKYNDKDSIKQYITDYCAYGCKYFIIKKNKVD